MTKFLVQKNGTFGWNEAEGLTAQDAIEQFYSVTVYPYYQRGDVWIFDDIRDDVDQLYGAIIKKDDLEEADLRESDLYGADLRRGDLTGANLSEIVWDKHTRWGTAQDNKYSDALDACTG